MTSDALPKKIGKLRTARRIAELEVERVVDLCLRDSPVRRLLDVGTGSGLFAEAFAARGVAVCGIDHDPEMLANAAGLLPGVPFVLAAAEALPFAPAAFDLLFIGMVLHETREPAAALAEARRVAGSGVAILEWPPPGDEPPPARRFRPEEIETLAREAGFGRPALTPLRHMLFYRLPARGAAL
jgi:ubiquinone/menaquinone biosynthesis C-methylase UbiE